MKIIRPVKRRVFVIGARGRTLQTSALIATIAFAVWAAREKILAQVPQPVLKITVTNSTQLQISITNAVASTNYGIYRTPVLGDTNFPWVFHLVGAVGQSNFVADMGLDAVSFFKASIGVDVDGDGVQDSMDANPNDSTIGILSITIDSPTNGANIN